VTMLATNKNPCTTCPYRRDVPAGVWTAEEYAKLREYDDESNPALAVFLCHQSNVVGVATACKGWVMVHQESVAVRLGCVLGQLDPATCFAETEIPLHESGVAAADFGEQGVKRPGRKALKVIGKLAGTGRFKTEDDV